MYIFSIDPHAKYTHASQAQVLNACGLIPHWFSGETTSTQSMLDIAKQAYGMPVYSIDGATLDNGFYVYPEDEPLAPYVVIGNVLTGEEVYIYPYGLCIFSLQTGERTEQGEAKFRIVSYRFD